LYSSMHLVPAKLSARVIQISDSNEDVLSDIGGRQDVIEGWSVASFRDRGHRRLHRSGQFQAKRLAGHHTPRPVIVRFDGSRLTMYKRESVWYGKSAWYVWICRYIEEVLRGLLRVRGSCRTGATRALERLFFPTPCSPSNRQRSHTTQSDFKGALMWVGARFWGDGGCTGGRQRAQTRKLRDRTDREVAEPVSLSNQWCNRESIPRKCGANRYAKGVRAADPDGHSRDVLAFPPD
jgi:hypothetical protein